MLTRENQKDASWRRGIVFELLDVAVFDLLHEGFAFEHIVLEIGGELTGHGYKLIVDDCGERNGAARRNKMRTPLEHEAGVPESEDGKKSASGGEGGAARMEELRGAIEKNSKTENKERGERNEKAVAVRRDTGPIGVTRDEKIKSKKGREKWSANAALPPPEDKKPGDREIKNGRPRKQAVIGREEHAEESGRGPQPVPKRHVARFESATVNDMARDESGQQADQ